MAVKEKCSLKKEFTKGLLRENPVLRLVLGTCPTLATSTSMVNAIGMGISATIVLVCSNIAISALRKVIPEKVRIPAYIVIIASFVTMVQMLVKAFVPALNDALGVYLPLIVVNCIILGRAEAFANKNPVIASAVDGLGMGIGFTAALFCMALVREVLGNGTVFDGAQSILSVFGDNVLGGFNGVQILSSPMTIFILPAGGFFVFGILIALSNKISDKKKLPKAEFTGCKGCPLSSTCTKALNDKEEAK
ncbi:MAG: electron transport complex subunit RsxE [Acutalibacteraceae bacterium]